MCVSDEPTQEEHGNFYLSGVSSCGYTYRQYLKHVCYLSRHKPSRSQPARRIAANRSSHGFSFVLAFVLTIRQGCRVCLVVRFLLDPYRNSIQITAISYANGSFASTRAQQVQEARGRPDVRIFIRTVTTSEACTKRSESCKGQECSTQEKSAHYFRLKISTRSQRYLMYL